MEEAAELSRLQGIAFGKPRSDLNWEGINLTQQIQNMCKDNNNENNTSMVDFIKI